MQIGVLALQGAFIEHIHMLRRLGVQAVEIRKPEQLATVDGLIIPGGESTTMGLVAERWRLVEPLRGWVHSGRPVWGTCAGMILLAERTTGQKQGGQPLLGGLDVTVNRNFFGRQTESFEVMLETPLLGDGPYRAIFIRAPAITAAGPGVQVLAMLAYGERRAELGFGDPGTAEPQFGVSSEVIVAVRQDSLLATAFHPELTDDPRWHRLFVAMVAGHPAAVSLVSTDPADT